MIAMYPPQYDLLPGTLLELPRLSTGWSAASSKQCNIFELRFKPDKSGSASAAFLPSFSGSTDSSGKLNLNLKEVPDIPVSVAAKYNATFKDTINYKFDGLQRVLSALPNAEFTVIENGVEKLANAKWDITNWRNKTGPNSTAPYTLYLLVVGSVYQATDVEYEMRVNTSKGGEEDVKLIAEALNAKAGGGFVHTAGYTIKLTRKFEKPLVLGVTGTLLEVDSISGTVLNKVGAP